MTDFSAAQATRLVRTALREAGVADSDYDVNSRSHEMDGVVTTVLLSGWLTEETRKYIARVLLNSKLEHGPKVRRQGSEFTLRFG